MITWIGHAGFKVEVNDEESGEGKVLFIDPWFGGPTCPESEKNQAKADLILVTHGHFDHCGDAPGLSERTGATVVCTYELGSYMEANRAKSVTSMNKGGTVDFGWVSVTMVGADHSGGCLEGGFIGGNPVGFVVRFKGEALSLYHAGDTNVFTDMKVLADLYEPKVALLPIGGHYTMGPREAAYGLNQFLHSVQTVVPMHFGTMPLLKGTPTELEEFLESTFRPEGRRVRVHLMTIGERVPLSSLA